MLWFSKKRQSEKGFSLIESLLATAIVGIGFVGVYSLVALSEQFTKWAISRQKLQLTANQILDVIEGDLANIDNYNLTLTTCTDPGATTTVSLLRSFEWCTVMSNEVGAAGATNVRSITITTPAIGQRNVLIQLEGHNGRAQIIMERTYAL